ncbi:MAG: diphthamide biosynthesis enzyme Dph2 [Candidatus Diapherotrites archaeon]|nr:diphthamide biosynthesis enzyme Dph2 [Candidatus Diapherotrites archaeon]
MLKIDLKGAVAVIKQEKARLVAVQAPEGLKPRLASIMEEIEEKSGARAFAFLDPCFGACDAADERAKALGADLLLHFGHSQLLAKHALQTIYLPLRHGLDEKKLAVLAEKAGRLLKEKGIERAALCGTVQFLPFLPALKKMLEKNKIAAFVGKGKNTLNGQVLGCNYSAVKSVERKAGAVLFLGDGLFHPLGISFCTEKPVFLLDPLQGEAKMLAGERGLFLRKRIAAIELAKQANSVAVWASSKRGQRRMRLALQLKKKAEAAGKKALVFVSDFINPDYLLGVQADAIVCTACPRIALDDSASYKKPVLNPSEFLIALGEKKLEEYCFEELLGE